MAEKVTYYAIVGRGRTADDPLGIMRRTEYDGGIRDEAFQRDLEWHRTGSIVVWEAGGYSQELVEVSAEQAELIVEKIRQRHRDWGEDV
jgi:hypothetical protein